MLREVRIENLVLARSVQLDFSSGLNLITGETGAGKSLIVDAVSLVLGARGESAYVRQGSDKAQIEAIFDLSSRPDVVAAITRAGYDASGDELLVRREIGADGRSRAFLGSSSVTLGVLRELTRGLVELHGQHEPQTLFQPELHRELLDRFGGHDALCAEVRREAVALKEIDQQLGELEKRAALRDQRAELLRFRLAEFDAVAPVSGEEDQLRQERDVLRHAEQIGEALRSSYDSLYEREESALDLLHAAERRMRAQASRNERYAELAERLEEVRTLVQEISSDLLESAEELSADPGRLEEIEERMLGLERLRRRFDNAPLEDVITEAEAQRRELDDLGEQEESALALKERRETALASYASAAEELSKARRQAGEKLSEAVSGLLGDLSMPNARIEVSFAERGDEDLSVAHASPEGLDQVEFLLQANPGEPARPLRRVASGGEISRVMLALDIALEAGLPHRTLIFDEVDQGLGGDAAERLGEFLQRVSKRHQVICVTHLPQVAACADRHVFVSKKQRSGRTVAVVRALDTEDERVEEIARMLGGSMVTETALRHAEALIGERRGGEKSEGRR